MVLQVVYCTVAANAIMLLCSNSPSGRAVLSLLGGLLVVVSLPMSEATSPSSVLAVTSADGTEGMAIITSLLTASGEVRVKALVSNMSSPEAQALAALGCEVKLEGSSDAFAGASDALILPPLTADRRQKGLQAITAAAAAGLRQAFLLSVIGAEQPDAPPSLADYSQLERALNAKFPATSIILRTFFYSSNLLLWAADTRAHRALRLPLSGACLAPLYEQDVAAVVRTLILTGPGTERCGRALELTGMTWHAGGTIAAIASAAIGETIQFDPIDNATAAIILENAGGLDASEASLLLDLLALQRRATPPSCDGESASNDFHRCTGQKPSTLARFFEENAGAFRP